ncbi:hypothetical protein N2152v2_000454 [Parachlorella kessleri]
MKGDKGDQNASSGFPGVRSLFGRGSFPGTIKLSRKARSETGEGAVQSSAGRAAGSLPSPAAPGIRPQEHSPTTAAAASAGLGGGSPQAVGPPLAPAAPAGSNTASVSSSSRRGSSQGSEGHAVPSGQASQEDLVMVAPLRSMSNTRITKFNKILGEQVADLEALRELSWSGIPPHLRSLCWRLLLGYLPPSRDRRQQILARKRQEYRDMVPDYYDIASSSRSSEEELGALRQVAVDVPRTAPGVPFFHQSRLQKSLERILYIWGIRHPASGYVQGINDLVTPFLAVFMSDYYDYAPMDTWQQDAITDDQMLEVEADSYWCLCKLLDGIQDHYTYAQPGIQRTIFHVKELVRASKRYVQSPFWLFSTLSLVRVGFRSWLVTGVGCRVEEPLAEHLAAEGLEFIQFAFRWVNCLLLREVPFHLGTRLWDTYLAEGSGLRDFLVYVLASFLTSWGPQLLRMEFQELIMFLQKPPTAGWSEKDVELVLSRAHMWRASFKDATSHFS